MSNLLLDTSIIIDFLRRRDKKNSYLYKLSEEALSISIITHAELYAGKSVWEKKEARMELESLFSGLNILSLNTEISEIAGQIKAKNDNLSLLDCIIAATAIYFKFDLVTLNLKDFDGIANLKLFKEKIIA